MIRSSFKKTGGTLGALYAVLCILLSFSMGSALQSECFVFSVSLNKTPDYIIALAFVIPIIAVIKGGAEIRQKENLSSNAHSATKMR